MCACECIHVHVCLHALTEIVVSRMQESVVCWYQYGIQYGLSSVPVPIYRWVWSMD